MKIDIGRAVLALALGLAGASAFAAEPASVTGKWMIHNNIMGNESDVICNLVKADAKVTGSCTFEDKEHPVTGSVDGDKVTWKYDSEYNGSPITLTYTATMSDAEKFKGEVTVDPFGVSGDFTAMLSK